MVEYVPQRGEVVWLEFEPQKGKEIKKRRPALVVSPQTYNLKTGLALFMPITSQIKGYPFECLVESPDIKGVILCDQMRSLDWKARKALYITKISPETWEDVIAKFSTLIEG